MISCSSSHDFSHQRCFLFLQFLQVGKTAIAQIRFAFSCILTVVRFCKSSVDIMLYRVLSIIIHLGAKIMNVYRRRAWGERFFSPPILGLRFGYATLYPFRQVLPKVQARGSHTLPKEFPYYCLHISSLVLRYLFDSSSIIYRTTNAAVSDY